MTKLVSNSLIGVCPFTAVGTPSLCAAHCSQRCFSIFLPFLISVRWTVAVLLQLSHFMPSPCWGKVPAPPPIVFRLSTSVNCMHTAAKCALRDVSRHAAACFSYFNAHHLH